MLLLYWRAHQGSNLATYGFVVASEPFTKIFKSFTGMIWRDFIFASFAFDIIDFHPISYP